MGEASRFLDTVQFPVTTTYSEHDWSRTTANFFDIYQRLDEQAAPPNTAPLTLDQRHRAAAFAAAAAALGVDAIVTNMPTAGRADVADNDVVVSVTADDAVAVIGHYLRVTGNPVVGVERGRLVGGGTWERTESTATVALPTPPDGYLSRFLTRDEIEVNLLAQAGEPIPAAWMESRCRSQGAAVA